MTNTTCDMVRSVLASLEGGMLTQTQALDLLVALGIAPRVGGILVRQSLRAHQPASRVSQGSSMARVAPLGA